MEELNLTTLAVTIANVGTKIESFIPKGENFAVSVNPGDLINFKVDTFERGLYYNNQATDNLLVNVEQDEVDFNTIGTYDSTSSVFTPGATYNFIKQNGIYQIVGLLPYEDADATLGLPAGNRFTVRIANPDITSKDDLPSGDILKITNKNVPGGYNTYNKSAFEADGSIISVVNIENTGSILEIIIKWTSDGWTTYTYKFNTATFAEKGE